MARSANTLERFRLIRCCPGRIPAFLPRRICCGGALRTVVACWLQCQSIVGAHSSSFTRRWQALLFVLPVCRQHSKRWLIHQASLDARAAVKSRDMPPTKQEVSDASVKVPRYSASHATARRHIEDRAAPEGAGEERSRTSLAHHGSKRRPGRAQGYLYLSERRNRSPIEEEDAARVPGPLESRCRLGAFRHGNCRRAEFWSREVEAMTSDQSLAIPGKNR